MRMRHILSYVGCPAVPYFFHIISNGKIKKKKLNIESVIWFSLQILCETFLILRRIERDMNKYVHRASCKVPVIIVRF